MPEIKVERLSLMLSGLSEDEGRHLARSIADGLAAADISDEAASSDAIEANVSVTAGKNISILADQIVADLVAQLNRAA